MNENSQKNEQTARREFLIQLMKSGAGLGAIVAAGTSFPRLANASFEEIISVPSTWHQEIETNYNVWCYKCTCTCRCRKVCVCHCSCAVSSLTTATSQNLADSGYVSIDRPTSSATSGANSKATSKADSTNYGTYPPLPLTNEQHFYP
jgi:hypothetical protein